MKKLIPILFLFIIFISFVAADPPISEYYFFDSGLAISHPPITQLPLYEDLTIPFYVYNISNGVSFTNESVNCTFHLYTNNGTHIYKVEDVTGHLYHFDIIIDGSLNFTEQQDYSYSINCQHRTENLGGYVYSPLSITNAAYKSENKTSFIIFILAILGTIIVLFVIADKLEFFYFTDKKGKQIPIMKYLVWLTAGWLCLPLVNVAIKLNWFESYGLGNSLTAVHSTIMYIMLFVTIIWFIGLLFEILRLFGSENLDNENQSDTFKSDNWWKK